jgi:hypothetical protein
LAHFWKTFNPEDEPEAPEDITLRLRSALWDDAIDPDGSEEILASSDDDLEVEYDSPQANVLSKPPPPTWYKSVAVPPVSPTAQLPDPIAQRDIQEGVHLPPPCGYPPVFVRTTTSPLMDQVIQDLCDHRILQHNTDIKNAFRVFLVAKQDQSARPVYDLSPWTPYYETPPLRLYSAAEVLQTIPRSASLIKIDLKAGFFQLAIAPHHWQYYGVYYRGQWFSWTRLPMGHPLAPAVMQRLSIAVARLLHQRFNITMVAYLDDWLIFSIRPIATLQQVGITINKDKSRLTPTSVLVYLGLKIDTRTMQLRPTQACIHHMMQLASVVPNATRMDLQRLAGIRDGVATIHGHNHP